MVHQIENNEESMWTETAKKLINLSDKINQELMINQENKILTLIELYGAKHTQDTLTTDTYNELNEYLNLVTFYNKLSFEEALEQHGFVSCEALILE